MAPKKHQWRPKRQSSFEALSTSVLTSICCIESHRLHCMSTLFRSFSSLFFSQQLESSGASSLILERLYYAEGRQNPDHPLHGSFAGLSYFDSP